MGSGSTWSPRAATTDESIAPFRSFPLAGEFPALRGRPHRRGRLPRLRAGARRALSRARRRHRSRDHALVCLPLIGHAGPIGGLVFSFDSDQVFTPERRALKLALARQAALALERSLIAENEAKLRERLAFLDASTALLTSSLDLERDCSAGSPRSPSRSSPTGVRSRSSPRIPARSSRLSSHTRIPSAGAGQRRCRPAPAPSTSTTSSTSPRA